jgi:hypothetical protein
MADEIHNDNVSEKKRSHEGDGKHEEDVPESVKKRARGPSDCLEWDDDSDDEEFVPYTQVSPEVTVSPEKKKVFARKSSAKTGRSKGGRGKKSRKGNDKPKKDSCESSGRVIFKCTIL